MNFVAIDVETANRDQSTICQVGVATFRSGCIADEDKWQTLVNPQCEFTNTRIHGLTAEIVSDAPAFIDIWPEVDALLRGNIIVAHNISFEQNSLAGALENVGYPPLEGLWADSLQIAKDAFPEFTCHSLKSLCAFINYGYRSHDALEDAVACGKLTVRLLEAINRGLDEYTQSSDGTIAKSRSSRGNRSYSSGFGICISLSNVTDEFDDSYEVEPRLKPKQRQKSECGPGCPDGPYTGKVVVFTEDPDRMRQAEAISLARTLGFEVKSGFSRQIDFLVIGDQLARDYDQDGRCTGKLKKATVAKEKLESQGKECRYKIISGEEFLTMIGR